MSILARHQALEKNSILLLIGILLVIAIGGIVEITPLFYLKSTIEKVEGVRPYTPLELAGRNIYVREGCYVCHSQMIRPLRDEVERYGHYSLAAESMYDHPFQWGSKRTGPDLARVGGKYSDEWHVTHLVDPRSIVPPSIMPGYGFLGDTDLDFHDIAAHLKTNRAFGVPYTDEQIAHARDDLRAQADPDNKGVDDFQKRYPKAAVARLRRQAGADHRDGRARRLSADARHPGRLQALRRQGRPALTESRIMQSLHHRLHHDVLDAALLRDLPRRSWPMRCGRRTARSSTTPPECRCERTETMTKREADAVTGTPTTGHEWDGIEELNTPLPRWWLWTFYATIVWAVVYWVFYPAWPTVTGYTRGVLGYTNRAQVAADLADLQKVRGAKGAALLEVSLADIEKDPALLAFAQAQGKAAFGNNCAPCHGVGATGAKGYPNLNDDDWLWGGTLDEIKQTIEHGVRSGDAKDHESAMPAFGKMACSSPPRS